MLEDHDCTTPEFNLDGMTAECRLVECHDGDTCKVVTDMLFNKFYKFTLRIAGIDTPEMTSTDKDLRQAAVRARNRMMQLAGVAVTLEETLTRNEVNKILSKKCHRVTVAFGKADKYGRILSTVTNGLDSVADVLLHEKLAYPYAGDTKMTPQDQKKALGLIC